MSSDVADPAAGLQRAREQLLARTAPAGGIPELRAAAPLRQVSPAVQARMVARAAAGIAPLGRDYPRQALWRRAIVPLGVVAVLDAVGIGIAFGSGHPTLGIGAVVVFVLVAALVASGTRSALQDPLRFGAAQQREIAASCSWSSRSDWSSVPAASPERGLVAAAAAAAQRIVASPTLAAAALGEQRGRLDLAAELDEMDTQAFQVARTGTAAAPSADRERSAVLTRVAALHCYAADLDTIAAAAATGVPWVGPDEAARLAYFLDAALSPAPEDTMPGA